MWALCQRPKKSRLLRWKNRPFPFIFSGQFLRNRCIQFSFFLNNVATVCLLAPKPLMCLHVNFCALYIDKSDYSSLYY
uniref:Uncharacterized protein n=1 Tax=Anguilla anguilla TaxID=7936 RepID=A0A0E9UK59_ANGAN